MLKKIKPIGIFCLLLCLFAVGCSNNDKTPISNDNIIYAPVDTSIETRPKDTETTSGAEPLDTDTAESNAPIGTEILPPVSTDTEPISGTDTAADNPDVPPEPFVPTLNGGTVKLGEGLFPGEPLAGRLVSEQSEKLRLVIDYECMMDISGSVTFDFNVGLEYYDINCGARVDTGKLTVDGTTHTFSTEPLSNSSGTLTYMPFTSYTYACDADVTSCTVGASWSFNGVYGGIKIDTLTVGAVLDWGA